MPERSTADKSAPRRFSAIKRTAVATVIVIAGVGLTITNWQSMLDTQQQLLHSQFERDTEVYGAMIQRELETIEHTGRALKAFYRGSVLVERHEFEDYATTFTLEVPNIEAVQWVVPVSADERIQHQQRGSAALGEQYEITSQKEGRWQPAGERNHYYPAYFSVAEDPRQWPVGMDWASVPTMVDAIDRAANTGQLTLAPPQFHPDDIPDQHLLTVIPIPPTSGGMPLHEIFSDVDPEEIRGQQVYSYVVIALRLIGLEDVVLRLVHPPKIDIHLLAETPEHRLQRVHSIPMESTIGQWRTDEVDAAGQLWSQQPMEIGDIDWQLRFVSTPDYIAEHRDHTPWLFLVLGLMATGGFAAFAFSITGRHQQVQKKVDNRTEQLHRARRDAEDARRDAEEATKAKSQFLANMSHEIRTPMNGIVGMLQLLENTAPTADQREYIAMARSSADGLLELINDILDFSKIEARELDLKRRSFDLHDLLEEIAETMQLRIGDDDLQLHHHVTDEIAFQLVGDPDRLRQVIINLVDNAIKFTEHGEVRVDIDVAELSGESLTIRCTVCDTGPGIPPEKQDEIFEAFAQTDATSTRSHGGTGLGLSIAAELVNLMDGDIWLDSTPGAGSTFYFTAVFGIGGPLEDRADEESRDITQTDEPLSVLLAEDNPVNQRVTIDLLEKRGHEVILAENGREAVRKYSNGEDFDVILMDIQMPEMDGYEATSAIREKQHKTGDHTPVIALTAHAMKGDREQILESGMDAYLSKPVTVEDLYGTIEQLMDS